MRVKVLILLMTAISLMPASYLVVAGETDRGLALRQAESAKRYLEKLEKSLPSIADSAPSVKMEEYRDTWLVKVGPFEGDDIERESFVFFLKYFPDTVMIDKSGNGESVTISTKPEMAGDGGGGFDRRYIYYGISFILAILGVLMLLKNISHSSRIRILQGELERKQSILDAELEKRKRTDV